ncbi:MAG TPA: lmo0937 family membrane protein [Candidatus Acidoferrales bacterium]|nr:lmo0937 family membrane protein [Candidatus Acidoferrales bacterium]
MLWTIFILMFSLWLLGVVTPSALGGYIHVLLFLAAGALLLRFVGKRHAVD